MGNRGEEDLQQGSGWWSRLSHICMHINQEEQLGSKTDHGNPGFQHEETMAQMKEQIKAPEKIQLSDEEIANLSDTEFKTLVIRMLTEMVEYGCKLEEKVKPMKNEIKENVQETNIKKKETRTQINGLEQNEKICIQLEQNEETRIQKK